MNERQPYEQLIADKLQQLPVPDADASWQGMKRLLDEDQSPETGGGRKRFRPGGGGRWWGAGIIAAAVITGIWVFLETRTAPSEQGLASARPAATANPAADNKDAPANTNAAANSNTFNNASTDKTTDQTSTLSKQTPAAATNAPAINNSDRSNRDNAVNNNNSSAANSNNRNHDSDNGGTVAAGAGNLSASAGSLPVAADKDKPASSNSKSLPGSKKSDKNKTASSRTRRNRNLPLTAPATPGNRPATSNHLARRGPSNHPHNNGVSSNGQTSSTAQKNKPKGHGRGTGIPDNSYSPASRGVIGSPVNTADEERLARQRERRAHLRELLQPIPHGAVNGALAAGDSLNPHKDTSHLLNDKTRSLIAKSRQAINTREDKSVAKNSRNPIRLNTHPFTFKVNESESWWGAGLSLNAPLPTGGQKRFNRNVNGGSSLLTDYLPSPYVEFHLNAGVYLQTEINLSAPQYVPQLCLSQKTGPAYTGAPPSLMRDKSIYIQKLYYFSWPVSLHYSPIDNLYLMGGLQFSSLQSGLALVDERRFNTLGGPDTFNSQVVKFKDDSIAAQLRPNEWRWQLGAEYYWNRLTLGMRYNRAFTELVSVGPANGVPDASIRNASVQLFLRFNFFESRKKDNGSAPAPQSLVRY